MALTAAQKTQLRRRIGDTATTQYFSDAELDVYYTAADDNIDVTTVHLLRDLCGVLTLDVNQTDEVGTNSNTMQHYEKLCEGEDSRLAYWESIAGVARADVIATGTTYPWRIDSDHTEEPDYE